MELFFRKTGSGDPLIILHGLYGSSDNWLTIGRALGEHHEVFMIDLRNHGHSPHHSEQNYLVMCDDLNEFMDLHHLRKAIFLGHSMGGKTAFAFGQANPKKIEKMILVDISPFSYDLSLTGEAISHRRILQGLLSIQPDTITNRRDADIRLEKYIPSSTVRQFLLKNLRRDPDGKFFWALNLPVLAENIAGIFSGIDRENSDPFPFQFPLLFIKGERSGYIDTADEEAIRRLFPWSQIVTIREAGHWVHAEQPEAFVQAVRNFIG